MIKARECRIGNRLIYGGQPLIVQPEDFHGIQWGLVEGIPLTPEILEQCGFSRMPKFNQYAKFGNWRISLDNSGNEMQFDDRQDYQLFSYNGCFLWKSPKHLHQLQNLYFALTGEELEVKL